jgi:hypothetical protein
MLWYRSNTQAINSVLTDNRVTICFCPILFDTWKNIVLFESLKNNQIMLLKYIVTVFFW